LQSSSKLPLPPTLPSEELFDQWLYCRDEIREKEVKGPLGWWILYPKKGKEQD